ncbi:sulfotransferase [Sphingomonas sp. HF-S3]|uniref:Sulfotransferase n=1 Tax=Sphingomonas rustica TaxID=3103142 RepID=A0ABV0B9V2_9SPHN
MDTTTAPIDRFRAAILADEATMDHLVEHFDPAEFEPRALAFAEANGIELNLADLRDGSRLDPLGIRNLMEPPPAIDAMPPQSFLPTRVVPEAGFAVDWAHFGEMSLDEPFFAESIARRGSLPLNRALRYRSSFAALLAGSQDAVSVKPTGFIFHMSRCGSTLTAQMLAASPANIVLSEPAPLDAIVQMPQLLPDLPRETHVAAIRAMLQALGRKRSGDAHRLFLKTDSWHMFALDLLLDAFPGTPWVFLYRDPVEVLVSQARMRGAQTVPGVVAPQVFGLDPDTAGVAHADYTALVLARTCQSAIDQAGRGGLMVDYRTLPDAVFDRILPHFGVTLAPGEREAMAAASKRDAKAPTETFRKDSADKQASASDEVRAAAERHLVGIYARLQALSASSPR